MEGQRNIIISSLRDEMNSENCEFIGPYGNKLVLYCDWTASGRSVKRIEDYMRKEVIPLYGNVHTTTSRTGHQTSCFRHEARQIIAESVNAKITGKAAEDVIIFTGNGTTGAVNKLIFSLDLHMNHHEGYENHFRPIVFCSSFEHHSNLLPWKESVADVVIIKYNASTGVDIEDLELKLNQYKHRKMLIGTFSAASNVTGVLTDVDAVSIMMHKYGGIVMFDYATAAPYVKIDMNPVTDGSYKDAIFFSGHKFLGGPGSNGVLIVKKRLLRQPTDTPTEPGGGTVFYVSNDSHRYTTDREEREESGTPNILSDVKLGLVMHLKQSLGPEWIETEERRLSKMVQFKLESLEGVVLLGRSARPSDNASNYLPIFSFLIRCHDRFLHYSFVCALLNDLFGIQARGGCMCAGPFSQSLLGIDRIMNDHIEAALLDRHELLRPGYTRLSFPFWMQDFEIDFVVDAIQFIADHGWKFLTSYRYNPKTGEWAHTSRLTRFPERRWISKIDFVKDDNSSDLRLRPGDERRERSICRKERLQAVHRDLMNELQQIEKKSKILETSSTHPEDEDLLIRPSERMSVQTDDDLRWFVIHEDLQEAAFHPKSYRTSIYPRGPIQPQRLLYLHPATVEPCTETLVMHSKSAFANIRNEKLKPRTGSEVKIPRYIELQRVAQSENINGLNEILKVTAYSSDLRPAAATPTTNMTAKPSKKRIEKDRKVDESDAVNSAANCGLDSHKRMKLDPVDQTDQNLVKEGMEMKMCSGRGITIHSNDATIRSSEDPTVVIVPKPAVPPKKLMKNVGQAIKDWEMIKEGDRLLLGLSGGKDSLALLHILLALQKRAPVKFELSCATVDPQTDSFDPSPLIPYVKGLGVTYHYLSEPIIELAKTKLQGDSLCAFCSRFKRGLLYSCCRNFGYNKLVLAQHLDDLVESFLMSALHNGQIRTMKAHYQIEAGDVSVIRPLIYVRESTTRDFSRSSGLPIINENCPACFEAPKERARMKKLMEQEEAMVPNLYFNLKRALLPLMHDDTYLTMSAIINKIDAKIGWNPERPISTKGSTGLQPSKISKPSVVEQTCENSHSNDPPKIMQDSNEKNDVKIERFCATCYEIV